MKFKTTEFAGTKEILKFPDSYVAMSVMVDDTGIEANADGKKIVPKGTIIGGATGSVFTDVAQKVQEKNTASTKASLELGALLNQNLMVFTAAQAGAAGNSIKIKIEDTGINGQSLDVVVDDDTIVIKAARGAGVAASLDTGVVGNNNAVTFTAKAKGEAGNDIKVSLIDPGGNSKPLEVLLVNDEVRVMLATSEAGAITTTGAQLIAAVNSALVVKDLVVASNTGASTGAAAVVAKAATALATGEDGAITSTANDVVAAINAHLVAKGMVKAVVKLGCTGDGEVAAVAATPLAGGTDGSALDAEGVLLNDVDVTHGAAPGAMVISGYIKTSECPHYPVTEAKAAMKGIFFVA